MEDTQLLDCTQAIIDQTDDGDEQKLIGWLEVEDIKYEICEGTFKIGRDPATCDILLQNQKTISKEHAVIEAESAGIFLMDLGSRNKTRLGKVTIKPRVRYALQGGEHLQFGIVKALFSKNTKSIENEEGNSSEDSESMLTSGDFMSSPNKSYVNQSSDISVISPTPQVSSKFSQSKILEGKNSSSGFVPETCGVTIGDKQRNFSNVIRESPSSQSTPFPTNLRSSLKNFTSPAFLSPISLNNSLDNTKTSLLSESDNLPSKSKKSVAFKLSYSEEEEIKEDSSSNDSTDIEEFFNVADNAKCNSIKRQSFALNSKCNEDIFNMATQPHSVESEKQVHLDISKSDANTQEVLLAFTIQEGLKEADNTQEILSAFEQPTQLGRSSVNSDSPVAQTFQNFETNNKTFKHPACASPKSKGTIASVRKVEIEDIILEVATQVFPEHGSSNKPSSTMKCHNEDEGSDESYHENISDKPTEPFMKTNKYKVKTSPIKNDSALGGDAKGAAYDMHDAPTQVFPSPKNLHESSVQICGAAGISREVDKNNVDFLNVNGLVPKKSEKIHEEQDNPNSCKVNNKDDTDSNLASYLLPIKEDFENTLPPTQVFSKSPLTSSEQETNEMNCSLPPTQVFSRSHFQNITGTKSMDNPLDLNHTKIFSHFVAPEKCSEDLDRTQVFCSQNIVYNVAQDLCDSNSSLPATQLFSHAHLHGKNQNDPNRLPLAQIISHSHLESKDQNDPNSSLPATQIFSLSHLQGKDHDNPNSSLPPTQIFSLSHLQGKDYDDSNSSLPPTQIFSLSHLQGKDYDEPKSSLPPTQIFFLSHLQGKVHDDPNCSLPPTQIVSLSYLQEKDHNDLNCSLPLTRVFSNTFLVGNSSNRNELIGDTDDDSSSCSSETLLTTANEPQETALLQNIAKNCSTISPASNYYLALNINDSVDILQQKEDTKTGYNSDESTDIEDTEHLNHPSKEISIADNNIANCSNALLKCVDSPAIKKNISEAAKHELKKSECGYNSEESTDVENELSPPNCVNSISCANDKLPNVGTLDNTLKVNAVVNKSICEEEKLIIAFDKDTCGYNSDESTDIEDELILSRCKVHTPIVTNSAKCSPNIKQLKENISPDTSLDMTDTPSDLYPNLVVVVPTQLLDFMSENPKSPFNGSNDSQQSPSRRAHDDNQADNRSDKVDSDGDDNPMDISKELFNLNSPCEAFSINSKSPGKKSVSSLTSTPANTKFSLSNFIECKDNSPISFVGFNTDNRDITKSSVKNGCQSDTPTLSRYIAENDTAICLGEKNAKEMRCRKSNIICKRKLIVPDSPNRNSNSSNNLATSQNNATEENILSSKDVKISSDNICSVTRGSHVTVNDTSKVSESLLTDKMSEQPTSLEANCSSNLRQQKVHNLQIARTKVNEICGKGFIIENTKKSNLNSNVCAQTTRNGRRSIAPARYSPDRSSCSLKNNDLQKEQIMSRNKRTRNTTRKETISGVTKNNEVLESHLILHSPNNVTSKKETLLHKPYHGTEAEVIKKGLSVTKNVNSCDRTIPLIMRPCKVRKRKASFDYEADVSSPKKNKNKNFIESHSDELITSDSLNSMKLPNRAIDQLLNSSEGNDSTTAHIEPGNVIKDIETNNKVDCDKNSLKLNKSCQQEPLKNGIRKRGRPKKSLVFSAIEQKIEAHNVISVPELPTIDTAMKNSSIVKDVSCSNNVDNVEKNVPLLRCSRNICNLRNELNKKLIFQDRPLSSQKDNSNTKISTSEDVTHKDIENNSVYLPFMKSTRNSCRGTAKKISIASNENDLIPKNRNYLVKEKQVDANNIDKENQNKTVTRRTRNTCKVKPSIGNGLNKRIVSHESHMIDSIDLPNTEISSSTDVSKADPSLNNVDYLEIKSTKNSGRLKGNKFIAFPSTEILASKLIGHISEGEQSYSNDNLNNDEFPSKQTKNDNSSVSKPEAINCEVVEEVCTKETKFSKPKRSVGKKPSGQFLHLSNETRTRCAAKRKASVINTVTHKVESISANMNGKREGILTSNLNDLLTNKKSRIARASCEIEEKKRFSQNYRDNKSKKSVTTEFITNENFVIKEAEKNISPAKCYLNSRPTRASCRGQNKNSTAVVGAMNASSQRQKKTKSIELEISTNQESTTVENKGNSTQKRGKKVGKDVMADKSKCKQESSVFAKDKNINVEGNPVCELSFTSEAFINEMKCPKMKINGSIIESAPSVRSTRSKRGSSPSFSRETILWSPSQRQAMANKQPRVLFTSYKDNKDEKLIINLGGNLVESVGECTVLVTNAVRRTRKFLASLGKGVPIVSTDWLVASKQAGNFVDPWQFLIVDKESEKKFGFNLKSALTISKKKRLFYGYSIYVTDSVIPPPEQMREIIECAGGEYLEIAPKINAEKILVISCKEDKDSWKSFKKLGLPILHAEFILSGLLKQQIIIKETLLADF